MYKIIALLVIVTDCQAALTDINAFVRKKVGDKKYEAVYGKSINNLNKYESIQIFNTTIETLEKNDIKSLPLLQELSFSAVGLMELERGCFHNLKKLKYLHFVENQLTVIPAGVFDELRIVILSLERNQIEKIDKYAFKNLNFLRELHLSSNWLKQIDPNWFVNCKRLRELHLTGNEIEDIQPKTFQQLATLKILTLAWNKLKTIPSNSFVGLKSLKVLTLSSNQLDTIEAGALTDAIGLKFLRLINNNLLCLSDEILESLHYGCNVYLSLNHFGSECRAKLRQFKMNNPHLHIHY